MDGNKIRRGPGRRIAKERRKRSMDPAMLEKYLNLSLDSQAEVNGLIETLYRQQVQQEYNNQGSTQSQDQDQGYDQDYNNQDNPVEEMAPLE